MTQTLPSNVKNQDGLIGNRRYPSSTRIKCSIPLQMVPWHLDACQLLFGNKRTSKYKVSSMSTSVHLLILLPLARMDPKPSRKHLSDLSFTAAENFSHHFHDRYVQFLKVTLTCSRVTREGCLLQPKKHTGLI